MIHHFVNRAIAELVSARASPESSVGRPAEVRLRDLLKFEFFFAARSELPSGAS